MKVFFNVEFEILIEVIDLWMDSEVLCSISAVSQTSF